MIPKGGRTLPTIMSAASPRPHIYLSKPSNPCTLTRSEILLRMRINRELVIDRKSATTKIKVCMEPSACRSCSQNFHDSIKIRTFTSILTFSMLVHSLAIERKESQFVICRFIYHTILYGTTQACPYIHVFIDPPAGLS
jgi:prenyltransferase beta subunit